MKFCIVNGDDFGASLGINRGIIEAHTSGILTSTSLMVDMPYCEDAVRQSKSFPDLSIGLHLVLTNEEGYPIIDFDLPEVCKAELHQQIDRFQDLMNRSPTHLDSHHNIHRDKRITPYFIELAEQYELPLREHSPVLYFSSFYGQWDGETHSEQVSVENLIRILETDIGEGYTELSCHPGYVDPNYISGYHNERELELRTLCDPTIQEKISELEIQLINFGEFNKFKSSEISQA